MIDTLFANKKANAAKLLTFGFLEKDGRYTCAVPLANGSFEMVIYISGEGKINADVIDTVAGEKYVLHLVAGAGGSFAGTIREEYETILATIAEACFDTEIFKSDDAKKIIQYITEKYRDKLEYLWPKFPTNAIFRRKENAKWYAALLVLPKSKLGIDSPDLVEIIDLRMDVQEAATLIDGKRYFPGYHMNKKSWFTICLDGSVPIAEIFRRIDASYDIAGKK